uniref:Uncharacterized protein n=1 Tax=Laticauda laticaudata TaxID=8630 RepID=A0A8C5RHH2_LATLA
MTCSLSLHSGGPLLTAPGSFFSEASMSPPNRSAFPGSASLATWPRVPRSSAAAVSLTKKELRSWTQSRTSVKV